MGKSKTVISSEDDGSPLPPSNTTALQSKKSLNKWRVARHIGKKFQSTESEAISETADVVLASPALPLTPDMEDHLVNLRDDSNSNETDRVDNFRSKKQLSFNMKHTYIDDDSNANHGDKHDRRTRRKSWSMKSLIDPRKKKLRRKGRSNSLPCIHRTSNASNKNISHSMEFNTNATDSVNRGSRIRRLSYAMKNIFSANNTNPNDDDNHDHRTRRKSWTMNNLIKPLKNQIWKSDSSSRDNEPRMTRSSNGSVAISIKSSDYSDSEHADQMNLSFSIMPRTSMRNIMSLRNIDPGFIDTLAENEKVGLLAESRAPSFNVMLHANDFYSDSCTLLKRKTVRITWEDLAINTNIADDDLEDSQDLAIDIGGRSVSDMKFEKLIKSERSEIFGVRGLRPRGSLLCRRPSTDRSGSNNGGIPLWSGTSTIDFNQNFNSFVVHEKTKDWLKSFKASDPRHQILKFFNDVANEGATGNSNDFDRANISPLLKHFHRSSVFTVWRPTSLDAIRRMMLGEGVGKGLDIKGKSAKKGKLSAFVPFLQIFEEEDKVKVRTLHKDSTIRIFFNSERCRNLVVTNLNELAKELKDIVRAGREILDDKESHDEETIEGAMRKMTLDMTDPTINKIDTYASSNTYGIEVQERLFWEGMVVRQSIYRKPGSKDDIGRTSVPSFQDMNLSSLRAPKNTIPEGRTRAVILQYNPPGEENNPMNPLNLLMAYEENDLANGRCRVIPVVSDFDCFIVGTRGVRYEEKVPADQIKILQWMIEQTQSVLEKPSPETWTKRWLNVLKESGTKGFHPKIPTGGYSDPKTRFIFKFAIDRLGDTGAVRHGAECYNYYFPQELDERFLVISDELPDEYKGCNWTYVDEYELREILKFKIGRGYTFPLNPKWVLCDPGWKEVYDKIKASNKSNVQQSLDCFYPPESGIPELIETIHKNHPKGFSRVMTSNLRRSHFIQGRSGRLSQIDGTVAMDLAQQELKYYFVLQRAKNKLRAYLRMLSILNHIRAGSTGSGIKKTGTEVEEVDDLDDKDDEPCDIEKEIEEGDDLNRRNEKPIVFEKEIEDDDDIVQKDVEIEKEPTIVETGIKEDDGIVQKEDEEEREPNARSKKLKMRRDEKFEAF